MKRIFNKLNIFFRNLNTELIFWLVGLAYLAFSPLNSASHFTICPLKNLGLDYCPGCGLGSSIINIFHLKIVESFSIHPLGIPALIIIIFRIAELLGANSIFFLIKTHKTKIWSYHGKYPTIPSKS